MHINVAESGPIPTARRLSLMTYQCDTLGIHAITLWLRGFSDQSMRMVKKSAKATIALGHGVTLCLNFAVCLIPALMLVGDLTTAEEYAALLALHQRKTQYVPGGSTSAIDAALRIRQGDLQEGVSALRLALDDRATTTTIFTDAPFRALLAEAMAKSGQIREALNIIDEAIREAEHTGIRWYSAEHWRVKGDLLMLSGDTQSPSEAERCYRQSLDIARQQGAFAWELRTATSLAHLRKVQGDRERAAVDLRAVFDRLTEGFGTADVANAQALLLALTTGVQSAPASGAQHRLG
jgi:ATP/maltotriose-dependent transcriptional regulator MalT